ncbi:hypothetical protein AMJ40_07490, partial [candidate division TA06 bacterium DG_26]
MTGGRIIAEHVLLGWLVVILCTALTSGGYTQSWYDAGWQYRMEVVVDNSGNPSGLTDYQVKVLLSSVNFDFSHAQSGGEDVRFTEGDGITLIEHWIEYWDDVGEEALMWVKVPSIPASGSETVYMYYGNPSASDSSDGDGTFELFDDFSLPIINPRIGWGRVVVDDQFDGAHNVMVEDVDGDNKPDIVATAYRDEVLVWYQQPTDPVNDSWTEYTIDADLPNAHDCKIGDIDGDGRRDIVGLSLSATWTNYTAGEGYIAWYQKPVDPTVSTTGWLERDPIPSPLADCGTAVYNGLLYVFGGHYLGGADPKNEAYAYDPSSDSWTQLADMPTTRWGQVAVEFDGKLHVFAGYDLGGATAVHEVYDPATDTWSTWTDVPAGLADHGLMGIRYGDRIHLFRSQYHYEYDPATDTYLQKGDVPTPRIWGTSALVDGMIYIIGGGTPTTNVNEAYDPSTDTWTTKTPMPIAKYGVTRENPVIDGIVYVTHGMNGGFYANNYAYDPSTDTWEQKSSAVYPRDGVGCGVINNRLYVVGGRADYAGGGTGLDHNEEYDPSSDPTGLWTKTIIASSGSGGLLGIRSSGLGDIDSDGDLDIAVVGVDQGPGMLFWFQNPGGVDALNPVLWNQYLIDNTQGNGSDGQIGDIDQDGNPDIVYSAHSGSPQQTFIYFAPDDPTNIPGWQRITVTGGTYHVHLVDFDGDDDLDILTASIARSNVTWLENPYPVDPRTPANWQEYVIDQGGVNPRWNRVHAADIDGDGDLDVGAEANTGSGGTFKWYRRPADPTDVGAYEHYVIDTDPVYTAYAHDAYLADIDMDGSVDMVGAAAGASYGSGLGNKVIWWHNDTTTIMDTTYIDPDKWKTSGATVSDSILTITAAGQYVRSQDKFQYGALRSKARFQVYANYGYIGFNKEVLNVGGDDAMFVCFATPSVQSITSANGTWTWGYNQNEGTDWELWEVLWKENEAKFYVDEVLRYTHTTNVPSILLSAQVNAGTGNPTVKTDWILVRNYSSPEPIATPRVEEAHSPCEVFFSLTKDTLALDSLGLVNAVYDDMGNSVQLLKGYEMRVSFDAAVVEVDSVYSGGFLGSFTFFEWEVLGTDTVKVTEARLPAGGGSGSGTLATIVFRGIGGGTSPLRYELVSLRDTLNDPISATSRDSAITVDAYLPTMQSIVEVEDQYYNSAPSFSVFGFDDNWGLDDGYYQIDSWAGTWVSMFSDCP